MSLTYELLKLPPMLLLFLLIVFFFVAGALSTYMFKKYINIRILGSHNEVSGIIFGMIGGFYALLLAFVVFLVWDDYNDAQESADVEGSLAKGLYRSIKYYPASDTGNSSAVNIGSLTKAYLNYVNDVLVEDSLLDKFGHNSIGYLKYRDTVTVLSFNEIFDLMERMHEEETYKNQRIDQMLSHLYELSTYRSLRGLTVDSEISIYIWIPLLLGGMITTIFSILMDIENRKLHIVMNGLFGAFVALIFYIVIISDHPFTGKMRIDMKSGGYGKIIEWERSGMMKKHLH